AIVVFAGAGASTAVNPREYPTTLEFFERLPDTIAKHTIFMRATEYLRSHSSDSSNIDIEQVLWALHELDGFLAAAADVRSVAGLKQQIKTGRRPGVYQVLDEFLWARRSQDELPKPAGLLTKLHGSVDWSRGPQGIYVGDPLYKGTHNKQVILYPGFKGTPT